MNESSRPIVVITGASSGIGAASGWRFAAGGYDLVLAARRIQNLQSLAQEIQLKYPETKILAAECDVNSDRAVAALYEKITQEFGCIHVLVNNAGYGVYGSVEETAVDEFRRNMETNYLGVIRSVQQALPLLRKAAVIDKRRGASIIMVSSIVGRRAMPKLASYCATKFALEALSESLRVELWDERIAVSVINPGATKTEFGDAATGKRPEAFMSQENGMSAAAVAEAIFKAARHPVRNKYLTWAGKGCLLIQRWCPTILDWILLRTWRKCRT